MKKYLAIPIILLGTLLSLSVSAQIPSTNIAVQGFYFGTNITAFSGGTNYWLDFNLTNNNPRGYYIYQSVVATSDVFFLGVTNAIKWRLISVNVLASGGDRRIGIPTSLPHLNTNGTTLIGSYYTFTLTNGNEFRITVETNGATISTLWDVFGQ